MKLVSNQPVLAGDVLRPSIAGSRELHRPGYSYGQRHTILLYNAERERLWLMGQKTMGPKNR